MSTCRRKKVLVDRELQLGMASRLLTYWCATWFAVFAIPILIQIFFLSDVSFKELMARMIDDLWFPMMMSLLMLPIVARDCVKFSHRVAGPVWRFRKTLRDFNDGKQVETIKLRKDDYCQELADEFNRLYENSSEQYSQTNNGDRELRVASNESAAS